MERLKLGHYLVFGVGGRGRFCICARSLAGWSSIEKAGGLRIRIVQISLDLQGSRASMESDPFFLPCGCVGEHSLFEVRAACCDS
jgi:hypothetical protein